MDFRILGPLEVAREEVPIDLGGPKQRAVLAHLILRPNLVVPAGVLIDALWADQPPETARKALQTCVWRLRRSLGEATIEGRQGGYVFHAEPDQIDAIRFESLVARAKTFMPVDPAAAAGALGEALALWRGAALADLAEEPSLRGEVSRLEELRLGATEHRIWAELQMGRHSTMVSELEALTSSYPLRERLWAYLMLALYRSGRQGEALDSYRRARDILAEELGSDPSHELRHLQEQILRQDAELRDVPDFGAPAADALASGAPALGSPAPAGAWPADPARGDATVYRSSRAVAGDLVPGTEFAGYRIEAVLGRGGMSVVYLAEHLRLGRKVALKLLAPQLAGDERFRERFVRESRIAAGMEHANIVPIYEAGEAGGVLFIAMRYVPGSDLGELIGREGALEPERTIQILREVANALDAAHNRGLVHRDVKPGNVLVVQGGGSDGHDLVFLSDFGLTKRLEGSAGHLTQTGQFLGTIDYVAPEQIEGRSVDARADVYSLACLLFECLTGSVPFGGDTEVARMYAHLQATPPSATALRAELPLAIDTVLARGLAKDRTDRFASCSELIQAAAVALAAEPREIFHTAADRSTRRTVTVLFADVTESTELGEHLDPERVRAMMSGFLDAVRDVVGRHEGTIERVIGSEVFAVFGIPVAHEDDPLRAVRAGYEVHAAMRALDERSAQEHGPVRLRVGIETGEVLASGVGSRMPSVTGDAVTLASGLQKAAGPEETLIGPATFNLVRDAVVAEDRPPIRPKGSPEPIEPHLVRLVRADTLGRARHVDTPMVDREREQRLLREVFERTLADRACQLFTILGAPGGGKSRLVEEFIQWTGDRATLLRGRCPSYGEGVALRPVAEMLEQAAQVQPEETPASVRRAITDLFEGDGRAALIVERAMRAIGISEGPAVPEETLWAIRRLLELLADRRPLVAVIDDVQSAKPTLLELIDHIADWSRSAPIMLVCLARPELFELRPTWGGGKYNATAIHLEPLDDLDTDRLIRNIVGTDNLPKAVRAIIVDAAEGNPLFAEEIVSMLIDEGALVEEEDGWVAVADLSDLLLPPTIAGILEARLDRLSVLERSLLERAALVGKEFQVAAVAALPPVMDAAEILPHVSSLVRKDLLRPVERAELDTLRFRHALIREAAYESIPKQTRSELHRRHADWLIAHRQGSEEVAAYHLEHAYRYRAEVGPADSEARDLAIRAGRALAAAGRQAFARGDIPSTTSMLERAVALLPRDEPGRAELLADLAESRKEAGDFDRTDALYAEMIDIAHAAADQGLEARAQLRRAIARFLVEPRAMNVADLRVVAEDAVRLLETAGDEGALADALVDLATTSWLIGDANGMLELSDRATHLAQAAGNWRALSKGLYYVGRALVLGPTRCDEAVVRMEGLVHSFAERPRVQASARLDLAMLLGMLGHLDEAMDHATGARDIFRELGLRRWLAAAGITSGLVAWWRGDAAAAEKEIREGYDLFRMRDEREEAALTAQELAKVVFDLGRMEEADALIEEVLSVMAPEDLEPQIESRSLKAHVRAVRGSFEEAEGLSNDAVDLVRRTDFVNLHGSVLLTRARVFELAGRQAEAIEAAKSALELFERKGNRVWAQKTTDVLGTLQD